jgi:hypothetical protein
MERVWALGYLRGSNDVAFGYDEGTISIKVGFLFSWECLVGRFVGKND